MPLVKPPEGWERPAGLARSYRDRDAYDAAAESYWTSALGAHRPRGLSDAARELRLATFEALMLIGGKPLSDLHWSSPDDGSICERTYVATAAQLAEVVRVLHPSLSHVTPRMVQGALRWLYGIGASAPRPAPLVKVREGNGDGKRTPPVYVLAPAPSIARRGQATEQSVIWVPTSATAPRLATRHGWEGHGSWEGVRAVYLQHVQKVRGVGYRIHQADEEAAAEACMQLVYHDGYTWDDVRRAVEQYLAAWAREDHTEGHVMLKRISDFLSSRTAGGASDTKWGIKAFLATVIPWPELRGYEIIERGDGWAWVYREAATGWQIAPNNLPGARGMQHADAMVELARWWHSESSATMRGAIEAHARRSQAQSPQPPKSDSAPNDVYDYAHDDIPF